MLLESRITDLHFAADSLCLSSFKFFWCAPQDLYFHKMDCFSRSRSSKVTDTGANRKRVCDFLLVSDSNLGPILPHFWATARFMCSWPHPYSTQILGVFPLHQMTHVGVSQSRRLKLFGRGIIFEEFKPIWTRYLIVTDGRTDGWTTCNLITALCASIAR